MSLAAPGRPWWSLFGYCATGPSVSGVSLVSSAAVRLVAGTCPAGLPLCTGVVPNLCCIYLEPLIFKSLTGLEQSAD